MSDGWTVEPILAGFIVAMLLFVAWLAFMAWMEHHRDRDE